MKIDITKVLSLGGVVATVLANQAAQPTNDLKHIDAVQITPAVTAAVEKAVVTQVQPTIDMLTNNDSFWEKRSTYAWIVSAVLVVISPWAARFGVDLGFLDEKTKGDLVTTLTTIGGIWASYAAYRAGTAKTPLFKK